MKASGVLGIEVLESRIAPAIFLVSSGGLSVTDKQGNSAENSPNEAAARLAAGSDIAFLLNAGDSLVYDSNGDGKYGRGDVTLMRVTAARTMVFMTDLNENTRFEPDEISGLAVADGFRARIKTDVRGDIVMALDAEDNFTATGGVVAIQKGSIEGLRVDGAVVGTIAAGDSISNLKIGISITGDKTIPSVEAVRTGTATDGQSYNFGATFLDATFSDSPGADGGEIRNVKLKGSALEIVAGNGFDGDTGAGGAGGSISKITASQVDSILAGSGGAGAVDGSGGAGGSVSKIKLKSVFNVFAGDGGSGSGTGVGGDGGSVTGLSLRADVIFTGPHIRGGAGGSSCDAAAGDGGTVRDIKIRADQLGQRVSDIVFPELEIAGGAGGSSSGNGEGGAGGSVENVSIRTAVLEADTFILGGAGGSSASGAGGEGGALEGIHVRASATAIGQFETTLVATGGSGGNGAFVGGNGGSVSDIDLVIGSAFLPIEIKGGNGGAASGTGEGGDGGLVTHANLVFRGSVENVPGEVNPLLRGGDGGTGGVGGSGGDVSAIRLAAHDAGTVLFQAGLGAIGNTGAGGDGGDVNDIRFLVRGTANVFFQAGVGAQGATEGGDGGGLANLRVSFAAGGFFMGAGFGGDGGTQGGGGGDVTLVSLDIGHQFNSTGINAGRGGSGPIGGDGGDVSFVSFQARATSNSVFLRGGNGGDGAGTGSVGGAGGGVDHLFYRVRNAFSEFNPAGILGGNGGDGDLRGGEGGALTDIRVAFDRITVGGQFNITAGNGGRAADGGEINNLQVKLRGSVPILPRFMAITSGSGGAATDTAVGNGGDISNLKLQFETGRYDITAGAGGSSATEVSGGSGGEIQEVRIVHKSTDLTRVNVNGGRGGDNSGSGDGGDAGDIDKLKIRDMGQNTYTIRRGDGGAGGTGGDGGDGGSVSNLTFKEIHGRVLSTLNASSLTILDGNGGSGGVAGGDGGDVTRVILGAPLSTFTVGSFDSGAGGDGVTSGGNGGSISNIKGKIGELDLIAGRGGDASAGTAGQGGDVIDIKVRTTFLAHRIASGSGGDGSVQGGNGGNIDEIRVRGDIGDFTQAFGVDEDGMGGIIAGLAGSGGTIPGSTGTVTDVKATRIAAIFAGDETTSPSNLTAANAVSAIARITANRIGADLNGDGEFEFLDNPAGPNPSNGVFLLGDGDTAIDGLVIALASGYSASTVSPAPLKVITV